MEFKVVPFSANITRSDTTSVVAGQMQQIIDKNNSDGWTYMRMDSVQTSIAGTMGCFGIGAQPAISTTFTVLVFSKP